MLSLLPLFATEHEAQEAGRTAGLRFIEYLYERMKRMRFLAREAALVFHSEQVAANTLHPVYGAKPTKQYL